MKQIENYIVPEKIEDRIQKLKETVKVLKTEFVGLDEIIDKISQSISPWYVTPEIIKRPVVISLWGMTGTGKTSVVKRFIELLGLSSNSIFFDCGLEASESSTNSISDKICDVIGENDDSDMVTIDKNNGLVFVFDEFQYARTIDESGCELIKSPLRPIWNIIDDGILNVNDFRYEINYFSSFVDDFKVFVEENEENYNIEVVDGSVVDKRGIKLLSDSFLAMFYFDSSRYDLGRKYSSKESPDPIQILNNRVLGLFARKLNTIKPKFGNERAEYLITGTKKLGEIIKELAEYQKYITAPKTVDCSRSLVFILGNLDEAFMVEGEINPDFDADVFYDITSKVTVSDIKEALKKRFRAEQIARFGNNLIKYPTLKREHFKKIIKKELLEIFDNFEKSDGGIKVEYKDDIVELTYSESVYPVQGVRPVFSTIGSLITPLLSDIIIEKEDSKSVKLYLKNIEDWKTKNFKIPITTIVFEFDNGKKVEKNINLQLGELRNPEKRKTRYINGVHESGHAILFAYCTGKFPINIVSVSVDSGGFCDTYNSEKEGEIESREDIRNDLMISIAGYEAEKLIFGDRPEKCLMGSSSDIDNAWNKFSRNAYNCGYFEPYQFANRDTQSSGYIPEGISDCETVPGMSITLENKITDEFYKTRKETCDILKNEKKLIKEMALYLGENGSMSKEKFIEMIKQYGNKLTLEYMEEKRMDNENWYLDRLQEI